MVDEKAVRDADRAKIEEANKTIVADDPILGDVKLDKETSEKVANEVVNEHLDSKNVVEAKEEVEEKTEEIEDLEEKQVEAKTAKERERLQRRIDKVTAEKKVLEKELRETKEKLDAKIKEGDIPLTEADITKKAEEIANAKLAQKNFDDACNRLADAAKKIDKEFDAKVKEMAEEIGPIPGDLIPMFDELDNGGEVLSYLTKNIDEAEELWALSIQKRALKLARLSAKLVKPPKAVSKVPAPIESINKTNTSPEAIVLNDKMTDEQWIAARNRQVAEKRKARMG